jgi:hypothetical protein
VHDRVVERAVGLDVEDAVAGRAGQPVQGAELVDQVRHQVGAVVVDEAAAEAGQVAVAHLGADDDPLGHRALAGGQQGPRVAGVEAAGHVGAADHVEHRVVVTELPGAEAFAEVAVEVHVSPPGSRRWSGPR